MQPNAIIVCLLMCSMSILRIAYDKATAPMCWHASRTHENNELTLYIHVIIALAVVHDGT